MTEYRHRRRGLIGVPIGLLAGMYGVAASQLHGQPPGAWSHLLIPFMPAIIITIGLTSVTLIWIHRMDQINDSNSRQENPQQGGGTVRR